MSESAEAPQSTVGRVKRKEEEREAEQSKENKEVSMQIIDNGDGMNLHEP